MARPMIRHLVWAVRMGWAVAAIYFVAARHALTRREHTRQLI